MSSEAPAFTSSDTTLVLFFMTAITNADSPFYKNKKNYIANIFTEQKRAFTSFCLSMFITVCSSGEIASVPSSAIAVISSGHCGFNLTEVQNFRMAR